MGFLRIESHYFRLKEIYEIADYQEFVYLTSEKHWLYLNK